MTEPVLDALKAIVGARHVLTGPSDTEPFLREMRNLFRGRARAVVRPGTTAEVAAVVKLCHEHGIPMVPQGGNTGLVGGQTPVAEGREVILSLIRLDKVRSVDPEGDAMIVEAGVTLLAAQAAASEADRLFPLSLASEGSCTIGGNLASNAGGTAVLAYGNSRDLCLGLEVVLADGRVWNGLKTLRKDNTGYDLRNLFIGSEGTLGIITAAALKLFPKPREMATAFVAVPDPEAALALYGLARRRTGQQLTTFELLPRIGIEFVVRHAPGARDPLSEPSPWYVLLELSSGSEGEIAGVAETLLEEALTEGFVTDAALAASSQQRLDFWRLREALSEVQSLEGGSIKHDVSVPVASVPAFVHEAIAAVVAFEPGSRPIAFGHMGDGNVHFNVSQPVGADKAAFLARWHEMNEVVHEIVGRYGGSISAEHGIGRLKRDLLPRVKDPVELELMRTVKAALDPRGLLNPGSTL